MLTKYTNEFKLETVKRIVERGEAAAKVARELDVNVSSLYTWVSKYKSHMQQPFVGSGHLRDEESDVHKMEKQIKDLKEENEILKKAAAYFAKNLR